LDGIVNKVRTVISSISGKVNKALDFVAGKATKLVQPIFDKLNPKTAPNPAATANNPDRTPKPSSNDQNETLRSAKVKADTTNFLRTKLGTEPTPEQVKNAVRQARDRFTPLGLKSLELVQNQNRAGEFDVYLSASPRTRTFAFSVNADLWFRKPPNKDNVRFPNSTTAVVAILNGVNIGRFTSLKQEHAEARLIEHLERFWTSHYEKEGVVTRGKPHALEVILTRSPCDNAGHQCGKRLQEFIKSDLTKDFNVNLNIRFLSVYEGSSPQEKADSFNILRELRKNGVGLSVVTLAELVKMRMVYRNEGREQIGINSMEELDPVLIAEVNAKVKKAQEVLDSLT
jgi:hypothetical protein